MPFPEKARHLAESDWTVRPMVPRGARPHMACGTRILSNLHDLDGWIDHEMVRGISSPKEGAKLGFQGRGRRWADG